MTLSTKTLLSTLIFSLFILTACQKNVQRPEDAALPPTIKLGVLSFTQPTTTASLITGTLPFMQGMIKADELKTLDTYVRSELNKNERIYTFLQINNDGSPMDYHDSQSPQGLSEWLAFGKMHDVDILLVPQVIDWHEREGSKAGVTSSAHIRIELYLLDINNERIFDVAFFEEKQVGLSENMLDVGTFFKRGAAWITATEMAQEAIIQTVQELNL